MNEKTRTYNAATNIIMGYVAQIGIIVLSFVGRRIFLKFLSAEYLGINGLYTNIFTFLSLPELGLDTAVIYSLYKPIVNHDTSLTYSLLKFFKRIYVIFALMIFALGIGFIPFLKYIVSSDLVEKDLIAYYLLFLINTVSSYFAAHNISLLSAFQEQRVKKLVSLLVNFFLQIAYIIVLTIWKNYYIYTLVTVLSTITGNIILNIVCRRRHHDVFDCRTIVKFDKKPIIKRIASTFLYKFGGVIINSTDNILISVLVSTIAVGFYSNYCTVVVAVQSFIAIITTSINSGIGNYAASKEKTAQSNLFFMVLLFYNIISSIGFIGFSLLFNDVIKLWLGDQYLFNNSTVIMISLNFYLTNSVTPVWVFREANGLFDKVKYVLLVRAAVNIALSLLFGMVWGVFGILLATAVSFIMTSFWIEPQIICNAVFNDNQCKYWAKMVSYYLTTVLCFIISYFLISYLGDSLINLLIKAFIIVMVTVVIFVLCNYKKKEFKQIFYYINKIKHN